MTDAYTKPSAGLYSLRFNKSSGLNAGPFGLSMERGCGRVEVKESSGSGTKVGSPLPLLPFHADCFRSSALSIAGTQKRVPVAHALYGRRQRLSSELGADSAGQNGSEGKSLFNPDWQY